MDLFTTRPSPRNAWASAFRSISALVCLVMLLCAAVPSHAASGKALVNGFRGNWTSGNAYTANYLEITNISGATVTVKVTFYKQDGTIITDDGPSTTGNITSIDPGASYTDSLGNATVSFDLAARRTTYLEVHAPSSALQHGYGLIEWTSASQDALAVMAYGGSVSYNQTPAISWQVPYCINNGMPF